MNTGTVTSWDVNANSTVLKLLVHNNILYAGGDFTILNGFTVKNYLAAIDLSNGIALGWHPNANGVVSELAASGQTIYAAGGFTVLNAATIRMGLAGIDATTGLVTPWNPVLSPAGVFDLNIRNNNFFMAGQFSSIDSEPANRLALFNLTSTCTAPVITTQPSSKEVCQGSDASFSVIATGQGNTYQWRNGTTDIPGAASSTFTISNAAMSQSGANFNVVVSNGACSTTSSNAILTVNPKPTVEFTVTTPQCVGTNYTYNNTSTISVGSVSGYTWHFGDGTPSSNLAIPTHAFAAAGNFNVKLVASSNLDCKDSLIKVVQASICTAIPEVNRETDVRLLQNLVRSTTTLRVKANNSQKINWTVSDIQGRNVMAIKQSISPGTNDLLLDFSGLNAGVYQISAYTAKGNLLVVRFVKL